MSLRDTLTNEVLVNEFDNLFDLVNKAIQQARARVQSGEGEDNPHIASDVMEQLALKGDVIEPVLKQEPEVKDESATEQVSA